MYARRCLILTSPKEDSFNNIKSYRYMNLDERTASDFTRKGCEG